MKSSPINIVWLKRDLRTHDHAPLFEAERQTIPYRIIYVFDPQLMEHPDTSDRHLQFIYHSILNMNERLKHYNRRVEIFYENSVQVFQFLMANNQIINVFSYQQTGVKVSWERDKNVARLLRSNGIEWKEYQRDGIIRGIRDRKGWDKSWFLTMQEPILGNCFSQQPERNWSNPFKLPINIEKRLSQYKESFQPAGETNAWKYLTSFALKRGTNYHRHISKPNESRTSCSRISTYLAWGNLSIKQAYQLVKNNPNYAHNKRAFGAFLIRLKWHCHFMQKFEVECEYETECINRGYELLDRTSNPDRLIAWKNGLTGYPLIDACMRALQETGWINFRMRAMVVSFLCHHLDQDWREGVYHLAKYFLDYEPGIHYPQFQMQAGTTGINTVRIYNPVKQSKDHDPDGSFIKKWVPELTNIDSQSIHEPWQMTALEQQYFGFRIGKDYPEPIVDLVESGKSARSKIWGHRSNPLVKQERQRILKTHTRAG